MLLLLMACEPNPMQTALSPDPAAVNVMHAFHSPDLSAWTHRGVVAWGVASLGMSALEDGDLIITLIQEVRPPTWREERFGPPVYGFRYDGTTLHPWSMRVDDDETRAYLDPQLFEGKLWYVSPQGTSGDPALMERDNPIRSSHPGTTQIIGENIADPAPIRFGGQLHLFATSNAHIFHATGEPLQRVAEHNTLNQAAVPHAVIIDDALWLVAQKNMGGKRVPVRAISQDAQIWSQWKPLVTLPEGQRNCTSPVLGADPAGGWILFCIEETHR